MQTSAPPWLQNIWLAPPAPFLTPVNPRNQPNNALQLVNLLKLFGLVATHPPNPPRQASSTFQAVLSIFHLLQNTTVHGTPLPRNTRTPKFPQLLHVSILLRVINFTKLQ